MFNCFSKQRIKINFHPINKKVIENLSFFSIKQPICFMFQGVYSSDTFSKSFMYCYNSNPKSEVKLALLCEVSHPVVSVIAMTGS